MPLPFLASWSGEGAGPVLSPAIVLAWAGRLPEVHGRHPPIMTRRDEIATPGGSPGGALALACDGKDTGITMPMMLVLEAPEE